MAASSKQQILLLQSQYFFDYYKTFFPAELIAKFLLRNIGDDDNLLAYREFSGDYPKVSDGWINSSGEFMKTRWNSFMTVSDFKTFLSSTHPFYHSLPLGRLHVGAHYNLPATTANKERGKLVPQFREFVVDIDLSDYDNIRSCCEGKTACSKCWIFIRAATTAIEYMMDIAFDYRRILWIFSGRRGIHGWFYDEDIHLLSQRSREAIIQSINFINSNTKKLEANVDLRNDNALLVFRKLSEFFCELLLTQHILTSEKGLKYLQQILNPNFYKSLMTNGDEMKRIEMLCSHLMLDHSRFLYFKIVLELLYPRFDAPVTTEPSHLIGCPFAAHIATGNIAIPVDPATFNIEKDTVNINLLFDSRKNEHEIQKLNKAFEMFATTFSLK